MSVSENGILQPNPALLRKDFEDKKRILAHELGEGNACNKCNDSCPGFQLHFWRKICSNCKCGKMEHCVLEKQDPGFYYVGKIFDRPLRSRKEELEFCFDGGNSDDSSSLDINSNNNNNDSKKKFNSKKTNFDWIPPNVSSTLANKYLKSMPYLPVSGSEGATKRLKQLDKQFPVHDIEPDKCSNLPIPEKESMRGYVDNVKENIIGQGIVCEYRDEEEDEEFPPPPPPLEEALASISINPSLPLPPPPPPNKISSTINQSIASGTYFAKPFYTIPGGSTSSSLNSLNSSRNESPSPNKIETLPLGTCKSCKSGFSPGDVVIKAARAGEHDMWHPNCFKCSQCKEILADLLYYYDNGKLYCGRDFAVVVSKIPRCGACDELIFATEYTGAENKTYHLRHFCCYECDRPLGGHKYISVNENPTCIHCFQSKHGKVCKTCAQYIDVSQQRLSLDDDHWHATNECFKCTVCHKGLIGNKMTKYQGHLLCSSKCKMVIASPEATLV